MEERRKSTSKALALLKARRQSSDSQSARRLRDEQMADSSSSSEAEVGDAFVEARAESTDSEQRKLRRRRERAKTAQALRGRHERSDSDVGNFIVDSDEEEEEEEASGAVQGTRQAHPAFSHFAFDMVRDADREVQRVQPGLGLLEAFGEEDGAWSRWSRRRSFDWYLRFLASSIAWRLAPAMLRALPETVDARAYAACVRPWEGSLLQVKESLVASQAWSGKEWVRKRLDRLPLLEASTEHEALACVRCEICERRNHPAAIVLRASATPAAYDGPAVWDRGTGGGDSIGFSWEQRVPRGPPPTATAATATTTTTTSTKPLELDGDVDAEAEWDDDDDEPGDKDDELLPGDVAVTQDGVARAAWRSGRFCALRVTLYSRLVHWKVAAMASVAQVVWRWTIAPDALADDEEEDEDDEEDEEEDGMTKAHRPLVGKATVVFDDEEEDDGGEATYQVEEHQISAAAATASASASSAVMPSDHDRNADASQPIRKRYSLSPSRPAPQPGYLSAAATSPDRYVHRVGSDSAASHRQSNQSNVRHAPSMARMVQMVKSPEWRSLVESLLFSHEHLIQLAQSNYATSADRVDTSTVIDDTEWASACCDGDGGRRRRGIIPLFVEALPSELMSQADKLGLQDWANESAISSENNDDPAGDSSEEDEEIAAVISSSSTTRSRRRTDRNSDKPSSSHAVDVLNSSDHRHQRPTKRSIGSRNHKETAQQDSDHQSKRDRLAASTMSVRPSRRRLSQPSSIEADASPESEHNVPVKLEVPRAAPAVHSVRLTRSTTVESDDDNGDEDEAELEVDFAKYAKQSAASARNTSPPRPARQAQPAAQPEIFDSEDEAELPVAHLLSSPSRKLATSPARTRGGLGSLGALSAGSGAAKYDPNS